MNVRALAAGVLLDTEHTFVDKAHAQTKRIPPRDRAFLTELVYGATRRRLSLDYILGRLATKKRIPPRLRAHLRVALYESGIDRGRHFIAMAYIPGETLAARLMRERSERDEGKATPTRKGRAERERELARLLADVAEALDHAHRAGVIHRDVKPSNIMIDLEGQTHLMDFGIARDLSREGLTIEGGILGT